MRLPISSLDCAREWPARDELEPAVRAVDACLSAASALPDRFDPRELVPAAIDELERVVRIVYEPGDGLAHTLREPRGARGTLRGSRRDGIGAPHRLRDHGPAAVLHARRRADAVRATHGARREAGSRSERWSASSPDCEAARVLCRLAALHDDADYRQVAVIAVSCRLRGRCRSARLAESRVAPAPTHGGADGGQSSASRSASAPAACVNRDIVDLQIQMAD